MSTNGGLTQEKKFYCLGAMFSENARTESKEILSRSETMQTLPINPCVMFYP